MMFAFSCFILLHGVVILGTPVEETHNVPENHTVIPIISHTEVFQENGSYKFSFETGDGIEREESGYDKPASDSIQGRSIGVGDNDTIHVQEGSYKYTAPDGTLISVKYIADENGFQPKGDHIPKLPDVHEVLAKVKDLSKKVDDVTSNVAPSSPKSVVVSPGPSPPPETVSEPAPSMSDKS